MSTHRFRFLFVAVAILAVGIVGMMILIALRPDPPREEPVVHTPIVETVRAEAASGRLTVESSGTVRPARIVNLAAEVPGKIVRVSRAYVVGGAFNRGDTLVSIDPSDYENAVAVAEAEVAQRKLEVALAEKEASIARGEWERLQQRDETFVDASKTEEGSLLLKEPQLKLALAVLAGAEARLRDARSRLDRTTLVAPFNGRIQSKSGEVGQYVAPGVVLASFYGTDSVEIDVALTADEAALIEHFFGSDSRGPRTGARVTSRFGGRTSVREGIVDRINGSLDPATRTYQAVVRVERPYRSGPDHPPLFVGTYVDVEIDGRSEDRFFDLPSSALRDNGQVWLFEDGRLVMRTVELIQERGDRVVIGQGLADGDQVVVSSLAVVTDGMSVRVTGSGLLNS